MAMMTASTGPASRGMKLREEEAPCWTNNLPMKGAEEIGTAFRWSSSISATSVAPPSRRVCTYIHGCCGSGIVIMVLMVGDGAGEGHVGVEDLHVAEKASFGHLLLLLSRRRRQGMVPLNSILVRPMQGISMQLKMRRRGDGPITLLLHGSSWRRSK